jgi:uncharacterized protein YjbJ (UPF0337 family)
LDTILTRYQDLLTANHFITLANLLKVIIMNKDQVKGSIKQATGKVQQKVGEAVGSEKQQAKGAAKRVEGAVQKGIGNAKENR